VTCRPTHDRACPPAQRPRYPPGSSRRGRLGRLLLGVLSSLVLIGSVGGYLATTYFEGTVARLHVDLGGGTPAAQGASNWLLVGTDSRAGSGSQYGNAPGQRSDTTLLAHLAKDGTTTMVSIPRDTYVTVPAYDANGVHHRIGKDKFTNVITAGGPSLLVATVEQLTGLQVDHYVSVDLAGFKRITDAVGGVDVCVKRSSFSSDDSNDAGTAKVHSINTGDPFSGWHGGPGTLHVNGEQALAFVRQRHGLPDGDLNRIQRQQQFLGSVFRSATGSGTLFNPARVASLLFSVRDALSLDQHTSTSDLEALAERLKGTAASKVVFATLPVRELTPSDPHVFTSGGLLQLPGVGSVVVYDQKALDAFLAPLRGQSPSPAPSTTATAAPVAALAPLRRQTVLLQDAIRTRRGAARPVDPVAAHVARLADEQVPVVALAREVGLSERQLHRRCMTALGYPPSRLSRLLRLHRFLVLARTSPVHVTLAELAAAAGYADQAHLSRDSRALTGRAPSAFRSAGPVSDPCKPSMAKRS